MSKLISSFFIATFLIGLSLSFSSCSSSSTCGGSKRQIAKFDNKWKKAQRAAY